MENTFGSFLKQKRQEKNLTQKQLADLLFVTVSAVNKWEKDVARPDISLLPKLSEILGVTEHELITASVDKQLREEKSQAKKWRVLSFSWSLFFYIAYIVALIPCFICNLVIDKGLTWFWIVLSALLLSFTFTNLPKYIKKFKLLFIPLFNYLAFCILIGVCCIYARGDWFFIVILSVLLGLVIIFMPIYICKYPIFNKIKKHNEFISVGIDFIVLNLLLIVINVYSVVNGYTQNTFWYFKIALPIVLIFYLILNILFSVKFLKINGFLKTSIVLAFIDSLYIPSLFLKSKNPTIQKELINDTNILKANLSVWNTSTIDSNIHCIVFLTLLAFAIIFLMVGLIKYFVTKNKNKV